MDKRFETDEVNSWLITQVELFFQGPGTTPITLGTTPSTLGTTPSVDLAAGGGIGRGGVASGPLWADRWLGVLHRVLGVYTGY